MFYGITLTDRVKNNDKRAFQTQYHTPKSGNSPSSVRSSVVAIYITAVYIMLGNDTVQGNEHLRCHSF